MTISSNVRKVGPFTGTGTVTVFTFNFKVFQASDLYVVKADSDGKETVLVLNSDYTATLNSNQDSNPGGSITLASALATGYTMIISSTVGNLQPTDLTNQGGFYPSVITDALDRATIQILQLQESVDRSAKLPITNDTDAAQLTADIVLLANNKTELDVLYANINDIQTVAADIDGDDTIGTVAGSIANVNTVAGNTTNVNTVAGNTANVTTVAGISGNVTTVAGISANVTAVANNATNINAVNANKANIDAVAGNNTNITAVAGNATNINAVNANKTNIDTVAGKATEVTTVAGIAGNVTTVAGISANVTAVANNSTNINAVAGNATNINAVAGNATNINAVNANKANIDTVAGISSNVTTVAGISSSVVTAATNVTAINDYSKVWLGGKASDPTLRNDGSALQTGDQYFNTGTNKVRVYSTGTAVWVDSGITFSPTVERFSGTGSQTAFTLSSSPGTAMALIINISGVVQTPTVDYTVSGTTLTFTTAPPSGTNNITVQNFGSAGVINVPADGSVSTNSLDGSFLLPVSKGGTGATTAAAALANLGLTSLGYFFKADSSSVAFSKTGDDTATIKAGTIVYVLETQVKFASETSITMPTLTSGTDYAVWVKDDATIQASSNHTSPPAAGNWRKIGGFHYAPGGNATGTSGGNTTPSINAYSFWDLKFRPACPDPRGMTLVAGGFWIDIYLTGVNAITNGSSKYNVTMADGSSPPKVPTMFGGNGSTTYGSYTWFEAMELATAFGKKCPTQQEFMSAMYGTTEASSVGSDQGSTILNAAYTSKWGVIQSTGVLWVWGRDRGGAYNTGGWNANTEGRGSEYTAPNAVLLGGLWDAGSGSGSRCSGWNIAASNSHSNFGSRFCCDHLQLD